MRSDNPDAAGVDVYKRQLLVRCQRGHRYLAVFAFQRQFFSVERESHRAIRKRFGGRLQLKEGAYHPLEGEYLQVFHLFHLSLIHI